MEILEILRQTCPARVWLRQRFSLSLEMVSGHHIVVQYDIASASPNGVEFTPEQIVTYYGAGILGDNKLDPAEAIAENIRERTKMMRDNVVAHVVMSSRVLDALEADDKELAQDMMGDLLDMLEPHEPYADAIWTDWLMTVANYITGQDYPELGQML